MSADRIGQHFCFTTGYRGTMVSPRGICDLRNRSAYLGALLVYRAWQTIDSTPDWTYTLGLGLASSLCGGLGGVASHILSARTRAKDGGSAPPGLAERDSRGLGNRLYCRIGRVLVLRRGATYREDLWARDRRRNKRRKI